MTPDEFTNQEFFLDVGDGHRLYVHDWGNAQAKTPILFLHGGPGNGCNDKDKRKFDPATQRVIFHDQRGAGKSEPAGKLEHNTSQHLVHDIGKIAAQLNLGSVVLVGGSWGSTLALLYGIAHPEKVKGMVIDGVFTATKTEIDWLDRGGWRDFFPDIWEEYTATVPASYRNDPLAYHSDKALNGNPDEAKKAAYEYAKVESALLKLDDIYSPGPYDKFEPAATLIEIHYLKNRCFIEEDFIIKNASKLTMPVGMVQGRYDMVCPPATAYRSAKALPNAKLIWTINSHVRQHEAKNIQRLLLDQILQEA